MSLVPFSTMLHVFCDESGGCAAIESHFLVTAVTIDGRAAQRFIRRFAKRYRIEGEVHGHELTPKQRDHFFDHLGQSGGSGFSATVICERSDQLGAWGMRSVEEYRLRSYMVAEACIAILSRQSGRVTRLGVTKDGGRYNRATLEEARLLTQAEIQAHDAELEIDVQYEDSQRMPGLQIADVIANTIYRCRSGDARCRRLEEGFISDGWMSVSGARLTTVRPPWLVKCA